MSDEVKAALRRAFSDYFATLNREILPANPVAQTPIVFTADDVTARMMSTPGLKQHFGPKNLQYQLHSTGPVRMPDSRN